MSILVINVLTCWSRNNIDFFIIIFYVITHLILMDLCTLSFLLSRFLPCQIDIENFFLLTSMHNSRNSIKHSNYSRVNTCILYTHWVTFKVSSSLPIDLTINNMEWNFFITWNTYIPSNQLKRKFWILRLEKICLEMNWRN